MHLSFSPCSRIKDHPMCCLVTISEAHSWNAGSRAQDLVQQNCMGLQAVQRLSLPLTAACVSQAVACDSGPIINRTFVAANVENDKHDLCCASERTKSSASKTDLWLDGGAGGWGGDEGSWSGFGDGDEGGWPAWANTA